MATGGRMKRILAIVMFLLGAAFGSCVVGTGHADHATARWPDNKLPAWVYVDPILFTAHVPLAGCNRCYTGRRLNPGDPGRMIRPWNTIRPGLLSLTDDPTNAQILVVPGGAQTWVDWSSKDGHTLKRIIIYVGTSNNDYRALEHEMGHALGFQDHIQAWYLNYPGRSYEPGTATCDQPGRADFSGYRGVMSYCTWRSARYWFKADDRDMIYRLYGVAS